MSTHRREWINRRGQSGAELAIDQIIDRQPQIGEQIHQFADDLIEDSPHQARQSFSDESIEDLAQGMREAGFQGVLIVRAPQSTPELFIAVAGAGNATTPADAEVSAEWTRQRLKLQHRPAALVVALLTDLAKGIQHLQRGKR